MPHPQLIQNVGGVQSSVIADLAWNNLQSLGKGNVDGLKFAGDGEGVLSDVRGQIHLPGCQYQVPERAR